jgi:hypothetical protein
VDATGLRIAPVCFHCHYVNKVWKLERILDVKDRDIVHNKISIAFRFIEFDRNAAHTAYVSTDATLPVTVEKRLKTGVLVPLTKTAAFVRSEMSSFALK